MKRRFVHPSDLRERRPITEEGADCVEVIIPEPGMRILSARALHIVCDLCRQIEALLANAEYSLPIGDALAIATRLEAVIDCLQNEGNTECG